MWRCRTTSLRCTSAAVRGGGHFAAVRGGAAAHGGGHFATVRGGAAALAICALVALMGCASAYRHLTPAVGDVACVQRFKPQLGSALYKTEVDVVGKHLSGLLVMKRMPDSSTRVVFTSEMGLTFFDFGFARDGAFTVHRIIDQMDKKAVKKTLRKDFELVLMEHTASGRVLTDGVNRYYAFPQEKGTNYYITDSTCTHLLRVEKAGRKPVVIAQLLDYRNGVPDSVNIDHQLFHFTITLKKLEE